MDDISETLNYLIGIVVDNIQAYGRPIFSDYKQICVALFFADFFVRSRDMKLLGKTKIRYFMFPSHLCEQN